MIRSAVSTGHAGEDAPNRGASSSPFPDQTQEDTAMPHTQITQMNPRDIVVNPQVRKSHDPKAQAELIASIQVLGILQPLLALPSGVLLAGHRRLAAALALGLETVPVIVTDRLLSDTEIRLIQLAENLQRSELTDPEIFTACEELMALNPGWKKSDLASYLNKDASMVTRILSVADLVPEAKQAFLDGKFRFATAYALSKLPPDQQGGMLAFQLAGTASRDQIEAAGRRTRTPQKPAVKANRVKCVLPTGYTVVVTGGAVSLEDAADALADAIKEMKRAREIGYTARTFAAAMADKARKRG